MKITCDTKKKTGMKREEYLDRIYGCWLGKNVGGTIGVAYEGNTDFLSAPLKMPSEMVANDDLDLQLVWLDILRKKGVGITSDDLAEGWLNNITYACDEYGVAIANLKAGLRPPVTGYYNNWFRNGMGAPIRSEIWACIASGKPEVAGWYALQDASVDHWDEGVYGEIFLAAMESAAFSGNPVHSLIETALSFIPETSSLHRAVTLTVSLHGQGKTLEETRSGILRSFGHHNFTDCVQNISFIIAGLLHGEGDFLKTIVSAVNCGYDTDCTGATVGAILGIMKGRKQLLREGYRAGEEVVAGCGIRGIDVPATLKELTEWTAGIGNEVENNRGLPIIEKPFQMYGIPEFSPPFTFRFLVSEPFAPENVEQAERDMLNNTCSIFRKAVFNTMYFDLNNYAGRPGSAIFLKTLMELPEKKKVKLFPVSTDGIKMWIDGRLILSHHQHSSFLPAPHRPGSPIVQTELEKGEHELLLEVMCREGAPEFGWIAADESNHLAMDIQYRWEKVQNG